MYKGGFPVLNDLLFLFFFLNFIHRSSNYTLSLSWLLLKFSCYHQLIKNSIFLINRIKLPLNGPIHLTLMSLNQCHKILNQSLMLWFLSSFCLLQYLTRHIHHILVYFHLRVFNGEWYTQETIYSILLEEGLIESYTVVHFEKHEQNLCGE